MRHYEGFYRVMMVPTTPAQVPKEKTRGHPSVLTWGRGLLSALNVLPLAKEAHHECCRQPAVYSHLLRMWARA